MHGNRPVKNFVARDQWVNGDQFMMDKIAEYKERFARLIPKLDEKPIYKKALYDKLHNLISEQCIKNHKHVAVSNLTDDECRVVLQKLHHEVDPKLKEILDDAPFKTVTNPFYNRRAKGKIHVLYYSLREIQVHGTIIESAPATDTTVGSASLSDWHVNSRPRTRIPASFSMPSVPPTRYPLLRKACASFLDDGIRNRWLSWDFADLVAKEIHLFAVIKSLILITSDKVAANESAYAVHLRNCEDLLTNPYYSAPLKVLARSYLHYFIHVNNAAKTAPYRQCLQQLLNQSVVLVKTSFPTEDIPIGIRSMVSPWQS